MPKFVLLLSNMFSNLFKLLFSMIVRKERFWENHTFTFYFCDRVLWINDGQLVKLGDTEEILKEYDAFMQL